MSDDSHRVKTGFGEKRTGASKRDDNARNRCKLIATHLSKCDDDNMTELTNVTDGEITGKQWTNSKDGEMLQYRLFSQLREKSDPLFLSIFWRRKLAASGAGAA